MGKIIFTIFQGPDAGRQFTLEDRPVTLGRDPERDVALHDDRASRLHARILPDGDGVRLVDEGSSNGTFVNGALVRESALIPGDIIIIGANSIVFGSREPTPRQLAAARPGAVKAVPSQVPGATTHLLPENGSSPNVVESHLGPILEAVAESVRAEAYFRGISLSLELEARPDTAVVDAQQVFRAVAGLLRHVLASVPPASQPDSASRAECSLAVRLALAAQTGIYEIEIFGVGLPLSRERIIADPNALPVREARRVVALHGGAFELLPSDAPATFARMFLPKASRGDAGTMIR